jgi:fumarate reductase flavoprotein subunit
LDNSGQIVGVKGKDYYGNPVEYYGNKIVIASGGFADNPEAIAKYWGEEWKSLVYGGSKGIDGTMIWAAINLGADTQDMDDVHIDAMLEVTRAMTLSSNLLRCGGILVRQSTAQRFADEQANHSEDAAAEMHRLGDPYFWIIVDDHLFSYSEAITAKAKGFLKMGIVGTYNSIQEIADATNMDSAALTQTINEYAAAAKAGKPDRFGRDRFFQGLNVSQEMKPPYYVLKVSNGVAVTTGGLKVNKDMQILDKSGSPIPGLWAVGEAAGGYTVHYVGGDALSHAAINGMLVGRALTR